VTTVQADPLRGRETTRIPLVLANWKGQGTGRAAAEFIESLARRLGEIRDREVLVALPLPGLHQATEAARGTPIAIAAQDAYTEKEAVRTWLGVPEALAGIGVKAVMVGRSDRRRLSNETDAALGKKVRTALENGLLPILWVGEADAQGHSGLAKWRLLSQVRAAVEGVIPAEAARLAIAYEQKRTIDRGKTVEPEISQETAAFIRSCIFVVLGSRAARSVRLLCSGGVNAENVDALMAQPDLDGVIVDGPASLDVDHFARIAQFEGARVDMAG
jgi:triosephosphate isomerase (TIM)